MYICLNNQQWPHASGEFAGKGCERGIHATLALFLQNVTNFGCFVALDGFRKKTEGLVHISQLRREGRVNRVEEVVSRGQAVKVKVSERDDKWGASQQIQNWFQESQASRQYKGRQPRNFDLLQLTFNAHCIALKVALTFS